MTAEILKEIQLMTKHMQAIYNDCSIYFSGESSLALIERKTLLLKEAAILQDQLNNLKQALGENSAQ